MHILLKILIAMAFSAFFSGMEIAFVSANKLRFEMDRNSHSVSSRMLSVFFYKPKDFISAMLVGNNIALVIYGILMSQLIESELPDGLADNRFLLVLVQTILSTIIILFAGEFLPKNLFKIDPNFTLDFLAFPTLLCYVVLYPIARFASAIGCGLLRLAGVRTDKEASERAFTKIDLDYFIQSSLPATPNRQEIDPEIKIFQNALDFSNVKTRDCIVPRTEIVAVSDEASLEELKARFIESGVSKLIVYKDNIDNIVGYIHSSEMFHAPADWTGHIRQLPIVPETMSAHKLLKLFMQQKKFLAVVVDEFGGTSGIVALEDLVEEICGEIEDEHDTTSYVAKAFGNNEYLLSGRLEIGQINELFGLDLPEGDDYQTIGGLILCQCQRFPKTNETIDFGKFRIKILKVTPTKIELVKLKITG